MRWVDELAGDLRFAFRYFARNKLTSTLIIAVLALGIGANTAIFSAFQAELMRPAPGVPRDGSHVRLHAMERATRASRLEAGDFSWPELLALRARRDVFRDIAGWTTDEVALDPGESNGTRAVLAEFVTPNFFATLGVSLRAGPGFEREQPGAPDLAAVMSFKVAEQLYGDATRALGRQILVNQVPVHVVGIAPPLFQGAVTSSGDPHVLWLPLGARADIARVPARWHDEHLLNLFARLAPDVSREQATTAARQVVAQMLPDSAARVGMTRSAVVLGLREPQPLSVDSQTLLAIGLIGVVGVLILVIACTNVSSLMVAAAVARRHEIAVRLSLGASRARIVRQLLTESSLLAVAGGAVGLMLYWWVASWVFSKGWITHLDLSPDVGTFLFTLGLAIGTGVLFGLSPALHASRDGAAAALRDSGTGATRQSRLQRTLVVAQIACSQPLLVLLVGLLSVMIGLHSGLAPDTSQRVVSANFEPLYGTGAHHDEAVDMLVPRLMLHPGIAGVVPEAGGFGTWNVTIPDGAPDAGTPVTLSLAGIAPGWLALLDVPIVLGRDVSLADSVERPWPVVIGSDVARRLWANRHPVGQTLEIRNSGDSITTRVVGVYDASYATTRGTTVPPMFTARNMNWRDDVLLVRTRGPAEPFLAELRRLIRAEAPGLPIGSLRTLEQVGASERRDILRWAAAAGSAGALALLLASLGLYGVIVLAVRQRTREIGIRIALGARPQGVVRMFLASGVRLGVLALAIGLPLSLAVLQLGLARGVIDDGIAPKVNVGLVGAMVAVLLLIVAGIATWLPARRAAAIDPASTLRAE
jgi:predicted permease